MTEKVHVEAARIADRDRLLGLLKIKGIDARATGEAGIDVPCGDGESEQAREELLGDVEAAIFDLGAPFVPTKHENVIYIRPPIG
jgi:hypothetical protein